MDTDSRRPGPALAGILWALPVLAACSGGGGNTGPQPPPPPPPPAPVASVTVSPPQATLEVTETVQLTAQARDAAGNVLTGRAITWGTLTPQVASVSGGLVTALSPGQATITATSEGQTGNATIEVKVPAPVVITSVVPAVLVEGQSATITGSGYSATLAQNTVRIDGVVATVTQASPTQLQITVPTGFCHPKGTLVPIQITVRAQPGNPVPHPLSPASFLDLAVGQMALLQSPADRCLQFEAAGAAERYVFGVQSASDDLNVLTAVTVAASIGGAAPAPPLAPVRVAPGPGPGLVLTPRERADAERWADHLARTAEAHDREREVMQRIADRVGPRAGAAADLAPSVPGTVTEGSLVTIRVAVAGGGNSCTNFTTITARVRKIGNRAIIVEDEANPILLDQAVFDQAAADFDPIYDLNVEQFGPVGDMDGNGRLVIVVTREVNRAPSPPLGFVTAANLFPTTQCAGSNEGEYFFMRGPDPDGLFTPTGYSVAALRNDFFRLLVHEFAHNIQTARRMAVGGPFMPSWLAEGLAVAAQEVVGFALLGRQEGQNYGRNQVYPSLGADPRNVFNYPGDHLGYWGWNFQGGRIPGAPEECTWLGSAFVIPGPCTSQRLAYGPSWSLIKMAIDRHHPGPAGQRAVFRAFSDYNGPGGFAQLTTVLGRPAAQVLAEWAPMLYIDDRFPVPEFQLPNWNLRDIAAAWANPNAELLPRMRGFEPFMDEFSVRAGSSAYFDLSGVNRPATAIRARTAAGGSLPAHMQIWVVRVE
jgi:hypothetical protein